MCFRLGSDGLLSVIAVTGVHIKFRMFRSKDLSKPVQVTETTEKILNLIGVVVVFLANGYPTPEINSILKNQLRPPPLQTETKTNPVSISYISEASVRGLNGHVDICMKWVKYSKTPLSNIRIQ